MARRFVPRKPSATPELEYDSKPVMSRPDSQVERIMRESFGAEADSCIEEMRKTSPPQMPAKKRAKAKKTVVKLDGDVSVEIVITIRRAE